MAISTPIKLGSRAASNHEKISIVVDEIAVENDAPARDVQIAAASSEAQQLPAADDETTENTETEDQIPSSGRSGSDTDDFSAAFVDALNNATQTEFIAEIPELLIAEEISALDAFNIFDDLGIGVENTGVANIADPVPGQFIIFDTELAARGGNGGGSDKKDGGGNGGGNGGGKGGGRKNKDNPDDPVDPDPPAEPAILSSYISGPEDQASGYNVEIQFSGEWTPELQQAFVGSADYISSIITGDIADISFFGTLVDDIVIMAEIVSIDGPGGVLGQAGPTYIRTSSSLPIEAIMQFDVADAETYLANGLWQDIVLHEMLHSIGVGSLWNYMGLVDGSGTSNPVFTGEMANIAYADLFPELAAESPQIPLEADGGPGTVESHWDEAAFVNELMTGYINLGGNVVSDMTVASLNDIGYETIYMPPAEAVV